MPLKAGRFIRFIKRRACRKSQSILLGEPRYRNTKNKRKELCKEDELPRKKRKLQVNSKVLNVYKVVKENARKNSHVKATNVQPLPTTVKENTRKNAHEKAANVQPLSTTVNENDHSCSRKNKANETPPSNVPPAIDDPTVIESWSRKPKRNLPYLNAIAFNSIHNHNHPKELANILVNNKHPVKCGKSKTVNKCALKNDLIDHPSTYLAPENDFVVASTGVLNLNKELYKQLLPDVKLSNHLISYILSVFAKEYKSKSIQFELSKTETIIKATDRPLLKITKDILIAVYLNESIKHFILMIVNCVTSTFSVIDPLQEDGSSYEYFDNFLNFVDKNNNSLKASNLPTREKWTYQAYDHQTQKDNFIGIFVLQYIKQYFSSTRQIIEKNFSIYC